MPARTGRPWQRVVRRVLRRDGGICHLCGRDGADSADHLVPPKDGGALYDLANLKAVHHEVWPRCNRIRGDRDVEVARAEIAVLIGAPSDWTW